MKTAFTPTLFMPVSALSAETLAWVAAVIANGGTVSSARQITVNTLIVGLKADGLFAAGKLDRLYLHAGENQPYALTDIVNDVLTVVSNSPTFTVDRGYGGLVATSLVDVGTTPLTLVNYSQNAASIFFWTSTSGNQSAAAIRRTDPTHNSIFPQFTDGKMYVDLNSTADDPAGIAVTSAAGLYGGTRSNTTLNYYQNGVNVGNRTDTSLAPGTALTWFLDTGLYPGNFAASGIGGLLTNTDMSNLYSRLRTYMTAVGVP